MKTKTVFFLTLLSCLILVSPSYADFTITYQQPGTSRTSTIAISKGKVRVTNKKGKKEGRHYMIYDSKRKAITTVDKRKRKYIVMTEKQITQMYNDMPTAEDIATHGIQNRIPYSKIPLAGWIPGRTKRKMTDKPARAGAKKVVKATEKHAPKVWPYEKRRVVKTNTRQKIGGFSCRTYRVSREKKQLGELCVASRSAIGMSSADYKALKAYYQHAMKISALNQKAAGPFAYRIEDFIMTNVQGVPLASKESTKDKGLKMKDVTRKRLPSSLFSIPKGYKQEKIKVKESG